MSAICNSNGKRELGTSDSGNESVQKKPKRNHKNQLQEKLQKKYASFPPSIPPSPSIPPPVTPSIPSPGTPSIPPTVTPVISSVEENPTSVVKRLVSIAKELDFDSLEGGTANLVEELDFNSQEGGTALRVSEKMTNGEYSLKLTRVPSKNPRTEHAHAAAMLMSQGDILRKLGENLLSHLGMSYDSEIYRSLKL